MRNALLSLIGFTAFVLCPTACPVGTEVETATDSHSMHHSAHADAGEMQHDHEEAPCDHCEASSEVELALASGAQFAMEVPSALFTFTAFNPTFPQRQFEIGVPRTHLATAGPPAAVDIVKTIVLRT